MMRQSTFSCNDITICHKGSAIAEIARVVLATHDHVTKNEQTVL